MAKTLVRTHLYEPSRIVGMTATVPTARFALADHLAAFSMHFPGLHLSLHVSERLLPDWTAGSITTTILMPHRRGQLPAVRAVVDFLSERIGA